MCNPSTRSFPVSSATPPLALPLEQISFQKINISLFYSPSLFFFSESASGRSFLPLIFYPIFRFLFRLGFPQRVVEMRLVD
jgi:hypothetical protein